jgi:hypothetical protein
MRKEKIAILAAAIENAGFEIVLFRQELNRDVYANEAKAPGGEDGKPGLDNDCTGLVVLELKDARP